ncbi:MAG: segregation/condensation protein A [Candidatus Sungbacteria bacterium]|uniref:Segregation and condensation protein A n=1 Tax=Candidatus Sungiibacteriota bacterium TaxID=2750080 RepID=A0A932YZ08_9BACT|nr:segregation/condensation protein A [Candidatus Sungbacteria bacterium]
MRMAYTVRQEKFEGPLDLLLELIQQEKLSINEISLAKVTDEFVAYLRKLEREDGADEEALAEFLVVASQLLLIKSRSLLPQFQARPEEEESIVELEERLREYQRLKGLAQELGRMSQGGQKSFSREAYLGRPRVFSPPKGITASMLASAFRRVLETIPRVEKLVEEKIKRVISLEEKIRELQAFLQEKVERAFSEVVFGAKERVEVIVSFLALLELAKQKLVSVEQRGLFGDITIRRQ